MPFELPPPFAERCLLAYCPLGEAGPVHPLERELAAPWGSLKRREEFLSGRSAAHRALSALEFPFLPIGRGPRGEPLWPPGAVASLAHDRTGAACLAARRFSGLISLGLDFEQTDRPVAEAVYRSVFTEAERAALSGRHQRLAAFCAKEAVFKALFPLARVALGFADAQIRLEPQGRFEARLSRSPWPERADFPAVVSGFWSIGPERVWALLGLYGNSERIKCL